MTDKPQPSAQSDKTPAPSAQQVKYPKLQPREYASIPSEEFISERVNDAIAWYDKSADKNKKFYLRTRAATVIGSALVPVLVNIKLQYVDIATTIISLMVVLLVSLESVYHFREQWTNYRGTEQSLRHEYFLFTSKGGVYASWDKATAYQHFVERTEELISSENASTLKIMSSLTESKPDAKTKLFAKK
ncbi:MAG: DUF4231 domain-containing protein [Chloroflexi bacterium]|nr:DUF4231 domain-containing protein [Chloroflexota bacterium]MBI3339374.1 DUF4231 domain-containing protein [Chloroflexota bacterium]